MRFTILSVFLCAALGLQTAGAQDFKRVGSNGRVLKNCALVDGVTRVKVDSSGKKISIKLNKSTYEYSLGAKYKFFACATNVNTSAVEILAKKKVSDEATAFSPTINDFEKVRNDVGAACRSTQSFPGGLIYKTVGSHHFTDCRRHTAGLIATYGFSGSVSGCCNIIDTRGNRLARLGLYQTGAGWKARWYNCFGCGSGENLDGFDIARKASSNTGSKNVYVECGGRCYGPIRADVCVGSKAC